MVNRIDRLMQRHNIATYAECERLCGLANGTIGKWKKGSNKPSLSYLLKLSDYFGVSIDYIVGRSDDPKLHSPTAAVASRPVLLVSQAAREGIGKKRIDGEKEYRIMEALVEVGEQMENEEEDLS